jgi:hypothetical protein
MVRRLLMRSSVALAAVLTVGGLSGCSRTAPPPEVVERYESLPLREVPDYLKGTLLEQVDLANMAPLHVQGYGLVVNLNNTGDTTAPIAVRQFIYDEMVRSGIGSVNGPYPDLQPQQVLEDDRVAIVQVDGFIPAGSKDGDRFDVQVSALPGNETSSLAAGRLWTTTLRDANRVTQFNPGENVNILAKGHGSVFVNPAYAAGGVPDNAAERVSLRNGVVLNGGEVEIDRPIYLKLRQPRRSTARFIEQRIKRKFQDFDLAAAQDEAVVFVQVPEEWPSDLEHFANLVLHLYGTADESFAAVKAQELAEAAKLPDAPLANISFAMEGLGTPALPAITPLISDADPSVSFAAARAAAFIGDTVGQEALADISRRSDHPHQLEAVSALAGLTDTPAMRRLLRELVNADSPLVRIEAYRALADKNDPAVFREAIGDKFWLEVIESDAPPLIYATSRGEPRIAILGRLPQLRQPATFATLGNALSFSTNGNGNRPISIFWRGPSGRQPIRVESGPQIAHIIARLGGKAAPGEKRFDFPYASIVAVLTDMDRRNQMIDPAGQTTVALELQEAPIIEDVIRRAEPIPDATQQPALAEPAAAEPVDAASERAAR